MFAHAPHAPRRRRTRMARSGAALTGTCFPERCLGSSEGCPARPVVSLRVDGRPIPSALRHRRVLERLWSKRGGRRPPWDLLRLPARGASARREPRRPTPGRAPRRPAAACRWSTGRPVASRSVDGRSFPAAVRAVHPPDAASAGRGGRGRRGAPPGAPRARSTAPRGAARPSAAIFTFQGVSGSSPVSPVYLVETPSCTYGYKRRFLETGSRNRRF